MSDAFPQLHADHLQLGDATSGGLRLRWLHADDLPWLRALYADSRAAEMTGLPWPEPAKRAFLEQQFTAQHRHYQAAYADAEFLAVLRGGAALGRLYLWRAPPMHVVVDISLFAAARGQGVGQALLVAAQRDAAAGGRGLRLHVLSHNVDAQRLYGRLGFAVVDDGGPYLRMEWRPPH